MTKKTIYIILVILLATGLSFFGYYVYDKNKDDDKKEVEIVDYQTCKDNEGVLSGNFNETCTKEDQSYTRELSDEEQLAKSNTYGDCKTLGGEISGEFDEICTVYNKQFTDTEKLALIQTRLAELDLTIPEELDLDIDDELFQEIKKSISKIGGEDYYYAVTYQQKNSIGGLVNIYVGFTDEEIEQLPEKAKETAETVMDEVTTFNIFYIKQDNGKYLVKIQNEKGVDEILDQIPDDEFSSTAKDWYRYDEEKLKELERDLDLEKWIEDYIKNHPES